MTESACTSYPPASSSSPFAASPRTSALELDEMSEAQSLLSRPASPVSKDQGAAYQRLLRGFYVYSIATEVWVICAGTLFLPVVLETYARANGRLAPEYVTGCPPSGGEGAGEGEEVRCAVRVMGVYVDTASFSLVVYSLSVALQAVTVISMGGLADDPQMRHRLLTTFALAGSLLSIAFLFLPGSSSIWPVCTLFALGSNISFGASGVCLNSYLPSLARLSPSVAAAHSSLLSARASYQHLRSSPSPDSSALLSASQSLAHASELYSTVRSAETSRISSRAIAAGYAAGIAVLVGMLPLVKTSTAGGEGDGTLPLRVAIALSGLWWLGWSIPALTWLRPSSSTSTAYAAANHSLREADFKASIRAGWIGLARMLREWRRLNATFVFLAAWFLLSDSFATLTSTAMLFAKTSLNLPTSSLILIAVLVPSAGIAGAVLFPQLQKTVLPWSNQGVLVLLVALAALVPLWGLVALKTSGQMYALSVVFGVIYGSFQSYSRSCFAELVPHSHAARWFGLYSITDKSSSFLGPMLVAVVTNATGQIRHGFWLILGFFLVALPILIKVDMRQGSYDAEAYDRVLVEEARDAVQGETEEEEGRGDDDAGWQ
ncbi:hypothetical protein JCM1840_000857 [Sporobolomyces johnsonii]